MNLKNIISVILILMLTTVSVKTTENSSETIAFAADYNAAIGLIEKCSISCSGSDGALKIHVKTQASGLMNEIGFRNITIQSSNDLKSWTDIINLGDFIESDRKYYTLNYSMEVEGNCYYRATCMHYANGIPFMKTDSEIQTAENFSKAIWINSIPSFTLEPAPIILTTTKETETTSLTNISAQTTASDINFLKIPVPSGITPNTVASKISTETTVNTSSQINKKTVSDSPSTGVNTPSAVFFISVISIITAIKSRKKLK